jgi:hypothetical protein
MTCSGGPLDDKVGASEPLFMGIPVHFFSTSPAFPPTIASMKSPMLNRLVAVPLLLGCVACSGTDPAGGSARDGSAGDGSTAGGSGVDAASASSGTTASSPGASTGGTGPGGPIIVRDGGIELTLPDGGTVTCYVTECDGHLLECGDCEDNDGDGRSDAWDPECLGPCDNTEGPALTAGVGGESGGACKSDCYFDFGNGSGNDDCHWDHRCDPLSVAPNFYPEGQDCALEDDRLDGKDCPADQSGTCLDVCRPLTPNGCDCFGCCTFPALAGQAENGDDGFVWIGAMDADKQGTCTLDGVEDAALCPPCTPVEGCFNDCKRCELCVGRDSLPDDCIAPPGGTPDGGSTGGDSTGGSNTGGSTGTPIPPEDRRCDVGVQACGLAGEPPCSADSYCLTGCCVPTLI